MTFVIGSICMAIFSAGWFLYRLVVKRDLRQHLDEIRTGAFVLGIWALVWYWLLR